MRIHITHFLTVIGLDNLISIQRYVLIWIDGHQYYTWMTHIHNNKYHKNIRLTSQKYIQLINHILNVKVT